MHNLSLRVVFIDICLVHQDAECPKRQRWCAVCYRDLRVSTMGVSCVGVGSVVCLDVSLNKKSLVTFSEDSTPDLLHGKNNKYYG